jgi:carbamoyltransferase
MNEVILGLNLNHPDASACIIVDGKLITAVEEERLNRVKHYSGFPIRAITECLIDAGLTINDVKYVAINSNPSSQLHQKFNYLVKNYKYWPSFFHILKSKIKFKTINNSNFRQIEGVISSGNGGKVLKFDHHLCHMASSLYPFTTNNAALMTLDGFGDFASTTFGYLEDKIKITKKIYFPHSLGIFYTAFTQILGFPKFGDEYKVMGLASYGVPRFADWLKSNVLIVSGNEFQLNRRMFSHEKSNVWDTHLGSPIIRELFSSELEYQLLSELGIKVRKEGEELIEIHKDLAASIQQVFEETVFHLIEKNIIPLGMDDLCLAGGCAMNSVMVGKIRTKFKFRNIFVQPAAGDAGGALGAAILAGIEGKTASEKQIFLKAFKNSYTVYSGPSIRNITIERVLNIISNSENNNKLNVQELNDEELIDAVAKHLSEGAVVGWFQGKSEFGPRALGNRSILMDPRNPNAKDLLNLKIKRREEFRPFAPSILIEETESWFLNNVNSPFMTEVLQFRNGLEKKIPAVVHADGSGRLQTVSRNLNEKYYRLIKRFYDLTGIPIVVNTSFNENEPIVETIKDALDCFLRTKMDILVLNNIIVTRENHKHIE